MLRIVITRLGVAWDLFMAICGGLSSEGQVPMYFHVHPSAVLYLGSIISSVSKAQVSS